MGTFWIINYMFHRILATREDKEPSSPEFSKKGALGKDLNLLDFFDYKIA